MARPLDELNALEESQAEEASGCSIFSLEEDGPKAKLYAALAWVHKRRADPKLKFTDHLKASKTLDNITYLLHDPVAGEDADDPFRGDGDEAAGADPGETADAEGPVLSGDGDQP